MTRILNNIRSNAFLKMNILKNIFTKRTSKGNSKKTPDSLSILVDSLTLEIDQIVTKINEMKAIYKTDELPPLINHFLFFKINFKDIVNLTIQLSKADNEQERNLLNRSLAVHLYEFLDDTKDFLGKNFKKELEEIPNSDFLIAELYKLKEYYKATKGLMFKDLGGIRHNTAAHKTHDSLSLHQMIRNIDSKEINTNCMLVWLFYTAVANFQDSIIQFIKHHIENKEKIDSEKSLYQKEIGVNAEMKKNIMILRGVEPEFAKYLCVLPPERIHQLRETVGLLAKELATRKSKKKFFKAKRI